MKGAFSSNLWMFVLMALPLALVVGCVPSQIMLLDPKTGTIFKCSPETSGFKTVEDCARNIEAFGAIREENLSPEGKAILRKAIERNRQYERAK
jgi:hypothetical protein